MSKRYCDITSISKEFFGSENVSRKAIPVSCGIKGLARWVHTFFKHVSTAVAVIPYSSCYTIVLVGDKTNKGEKANYIATLKTSFSTWERWHWVPLSVASLAYAIILIVLP